ncbi:hypothetical protein IC235_11300 [Hymenobacter sp. BT664]|uniref:Uncharacterized protein n=1 Tax=Hymenobacter montanus TaxID=2771359 RepID=A0A927GJJ4_9BACT|nr:hypothetical protein [Hymenobacter montanus]MBD2768475.1 hypothetical protein [Hymenobacter montanus]
MRHLPARYRNGYHRTLTRQQRRNRWLLYGALVLLTITSNCYVARCQRVEPVTEPGRWAILSFTDAEYTKLGRSEYIIDRLGLDK